MHTLQDRIKIARYLMSHPDGNFLVDTSPNRHLAPDYVASLQVLLNCFNDVACHGGSPAQAWKWAADFEGGGVPVEGCMPYAAEEGRACDAVNICQNCMGTANWTAEKSAAGDPGQYHCFAVPSDAPRNVPCFGDGICAVQPYPRLGVDKFGKIPKLDETAVRKEIAARGPVACALDATAMLAFDGVGVLEDEPELAAARLEDRIHPTVGSLLNSKNATDHIVEVVGWGVDKATGVEFWELRNSWGDYWGDGGFARVRRGRNDLLLESDCEWVLPSGWGVPLSANPHSRQAWQTYDAEAVDRGALAMVAAVASLEASSRYESAKLEGASMAPAPPSSWWFASFCAVVFVIVVTVLALLLDARANLKATPTSAQQQQQGVELPAFATNLKSLVTPRRGGYSEL